jgi:hypothetical protein
MGLVVKDDGWRTLHITRMRNRALYKRWQFRMNVAAETSACFSSIVGFEHLKNRADLHTHFSN